MKEKEKIWCGSFGGMVCGFLLLVMVEKLPIWSCYARPIIDSMIITFGIISIMFGVIYMIYRCRYFKKIWKDLWRD